MAGLQTLRIRPGFGGLNTADQPRELSPTQAAKLENMLVDRDGTVRMRGPIRTQFTTPSNPETGFPAVTRQSNVLIPKTSGASLDYAVVDGPSGTSVGNWTAGAGAYPLAYTPSAEVSGDAYFVSNAGPLVRWNGSSGAVALTQGPYSARAVASHLGRLWVLGGNTPGAGAGSRDGVDLNWTDVGGSPTNNLNEWKDDVTTLVNHIDLGDNYDPGNALARVGRTLVILRQNSIWALTGDTSSTFAVQRVVSGVGSLLYGQALEWDTGVFFVSPNGFHVFDGLNVQNMGGAVAGDIAAAIAYVQRASMARLDHEHLMLLIPGSPAFFGILNVPRRAWSTVSLPANFNASTPQLIGNAGGSTWMWDGVSLYGIQRLNGGLRYGVTLPDSVDSSSYLGIDDTSLSIGGSQKAVPTKWWSKVHDLSAPPLKVQLHRLMVEYDFRVASGSPSPGLQVSLYDSLGTQLGSTTTLAAGTTRQRAHIDVYTETSDVQVRIEYSNSSAHNVTKLELYDCFLEYQPTSQR